MRDEELRHKNGCCCDTSPDSDGPERMCPVHGQWPGAFAEIHRDGVLRIDLRQHLAYHGVQPGEVVYMELHTVRDHTNDHPMLEEPKEPEVTYSASYPRQSVSWSSASGATKVDGALIFDATYTDEDDDVLEDEEYTPDSDHMPASLTIAPGSLDLPDV